MKSISLRIHGVDEENKKKGDDLREECRHCSTHPLSTGERLCDESEWLGGETNVDVACFTAAFDVSAFICSSIWVAASTM